jgi:transcriptional regulator
MYLPKPFEETDPEALHGFIAAYPLGALVLNGPNGLDANHLPFEFEPGQGSGRLLAHVARANPLWREAREGDEVLVIFRGPEGYISPGWYPGKAETHRVVPTWNYQVVHVHGRIAIRDDERFVRGLVARLTRTHESGTGAPPWKMSDAPAEYIDEMLQAIVGIEITVTRITGKFKLGQNRETRDREGAADALHARGHTALAEAMRHSKEGKKP